MKHSRERSIKDKIVAHPFGEFCSRGLVHGAVALGLFMGVQTLHAQGYPPPPYGAQAPRGSAVEQTMDDLQRIARASRASSNRERERFDNALRHLAEFQDRMRRRQFDKDKLDQAIEDVQNIVNNNRLDRRARNVLSSDLGALRTMRARYGHR